MTGHRPGASLPDAAVSRIRAQVSALLENAAASVDGIWKRNSAVFSPEPPLLVLVSAVAEGADRIVTEEALRAGWTLDAVLPFARDDYAQDFSTPESKAEFARLLARARAVLAIDSAQSHHERAVAYEAAGTVMLDHADVLLAIWDGEDSRGRGGTRDTMASAASRGLPVVWCHSETDQPLMTWDESGAASPTAAGTGNEPGSFGALITAAIAPPSDRGAGATSPEPLPAFLRESRRRLPWWKGAFAAGLYLLTGKAFGAHHDRQEQWQAFLGALPPNGALAGELGRVLQQRFVWADQTATELGAVYRSAYLLNFLLAGCAVFVGLLAILDVWNDLFPNLVVAKTVSVSLEFLLILAIVAITMAGRRRAWHRHFLDARRLAEMLRHASLLTPLGTSGQRAHLHTRTTDAADAWTLWYIQASLRELPVPDAHVDASYLRRTLAAVLDHEVTGQLRYHHDNQHLLETVHHRLDRAGELLFYATGFLCLVWFTVIAVFGFEGADHHHEISHTLKTILTFLAAVFPAFAAAIGGIRAQGDFATSARQSQTTEAELKRLLASARKRMPDDYQSACGLMQALADRMTLDLEAWRLLSINRPITVPG